MALPLRPILRTYAATAGQQPTSGGGSKPRVFPTPQGDFYTKLALRGSGEADHAPANELLGNRMLEVLGVERPQLAFVSLLPPIASQLPEYSGRLSDTGMGVGVIVGATDLADPLAAVAARVAPKYELVANIAVLDWLQVGDHETHNWLLVGTRVVAIDFASGPPDSVWRGGSLGATRPNHGRFRAEVLASSPTERKIVRERLRSFTATELQEVLAEIPDEWATSAERAHLGAELLRAKEGVINDL